MTLLSRSAIISVAIQNKGGEFFHPMGRVWGISTIGLLPLSTGKIIPSFGA